MLDVVLLHGLGGSHLFWEDVEPLIEPPVRALDLPSHGSVAEMAGELVAGLERPAVLVGHSLGGMVAQEMALAAPDLVAGIVLSNTIPAATARVVALNSAMAAFVELRGSAAMCETVTPRLFGPEDLEGSVRAKARLRTDMTAKPRAQLAANLLAICGFGAAKRLHTCGVPALVVAGEHEPNVDEQRELAHLLVADIVIMPGTNHMSPAEQPTAFVAAIEGFLKEHR